MFPFHIPHYVPPLGYRQIHLQPISEKSEPQSTTSNEFIDGLCHYVDEEGMHRVFDWDEDLCPPDGDEILRQVLLKKIHSPKKQRASSSSIENYESIEEEPSSGNHASLGQFMEYYQSPSNNPPLNFNYPQLSNYYRSYEEYLWLMRQRMHDDELQRGQDMIKDFSTPFLQ